MQIKSKRIEPIERPKKKITVTQLRGQLPRVAITLDQTVQIREFNPSRIAIYAAMDVEQNSSIIDTLNELDKSITPFMAKKVKALIIARNKSKQK